MGKHETYDIRPIGYVRSSLLEASGAPRQGYEGAPSAWLELLPSAGPGLQGLEAGRDVVLITWLHKARRDVLAVHPRRDDSNPLRGVFATRSPDRPNPVALHRVTLLEIKDGRLKVGPLEAMDGTPIVDIKPALPAPADQ